MKAFSIFASGWTKGGLAGFLIALVVPAHAVIFYSTADQNYNTTPPLGALANSGWQWVGVWGGFTGTPISSHHFIAANHVGGSVGDPFVFNGVTYTTISEVHDPQTDLSVWEVSASFPTWAPLYSSSTEVSRPLVVFGRGLSRGAEVRVNGVLKGWEWGTGAGVLRWGQNQVASVVDGGSGLGQLLYATFDSTGGVNEAHLAVGDSSGAIFIQDAGTWKLAGVAYAVDAYFNTTNSGSGFEAAIFDASGLYYGSTGNWRLVTAPTPSGFYATRISARIPWIDSIIAADATSVDIPLWTPIHSLVLTIIIIGGATWKLSVQASREAAGVEGVRRLC